MPIFDTHTYLEGYPIPGVNQIPAQMIKILESRGIDRSIVFSGRACHADPLSGNRILRTMIEGEQAMFGCLVAHLNRVDSSLQAIRELLGLPKFVAVLVTSTNPQEPLHPLLADEVLHVCRRFHKPIFLPTPHAAAVEVAVLLATKYPMHRFILLGMGGQDWRTAIAAAQHCPNMYLEISGPLDRAKVPAAVQSLGPNRVIFGSGMPHLDPAAVLGMIEDTDVLQVHRRRILHENAFRLFNVAQLEAIPEPEEPPEPDAEDVHGLSDMSPA